MSWAVIDIVFIAIIVIASIRGAFIGMISEILSLAALFISLLLAAVFYNDGAKWIQKRSSFEDVAFIMAFAAIFLASFLLFKVLQKGVRTLLNESSMEGMDKLLGFFFGLLEGLLIIFLLVYLLNFQTFFDTSPVVKGSELIPYMERFLPSLDATGEDLINQLNI